MTDYTDFGFNPIHPYFLKTDIFSEDFWLGKKRNRENFNCIIKKRGWNQKFHGLDVIFKSEQQNTRSLLNKLGFSWIMNCHEVSVNPKDIVAVKQSSVVSLKKAMAYLISFDDFKIFLIHRYIKTHYWNPVGDLSSKKWDKLFANNASFDFFVLSIRNGEIIAISWASLTKYHLDIIWTFVTNQVTLVNRQKLVQRVVLEQIRLAMAKNLKRITFEIDSTDKDLFPILHLLTPREETILKRYRLKF